MSLPPISSPTTASHIHLGQPEKTTSAPFIIKDGKKYKVEVQTIQHGIAWKVWQGTQAFFLTLVSLGIGLAFQALRDKWEQAITGEEKKTFYTRFPVEVTSTAKATKIGSTLYPSSILSDEDVRNFIDAAQRDITQLSILKLEEGLGKALEIGSSITHPSDKTTILTVAERVAQSYLTANNYTKAWQVRMLAAQAIAPAPPLGDLAVELQSEHPKLGLRLQPVDTSLFKNHTLAVQKRKYADGQTQLHVNAKLSHHARVHIQSTLNAIESNSKTLLTALPKGFCKNINVTTDRLQYQGRETKAGKKWEGDFSKDVNNHGYYYYSAEVKVIEFEGVGKVKIGNKDWVRGGYNHLSIELDPNISEAEAAAKLNIIFAALGLGPVSSTSRAEDVERIKVMQLFRAFYPKEAHAFEREAKSFEESVESLKNRIAIKVPAMQNKFKHYLVDHPELIYQQEVYSDQMVWAIEGLAQEVRNAGGYGLMAGVFGADFTDATKRLTSMLRTGALSTQDRFQLGIIAAGASVDEDIRTGGAESVFTRLLTNGMPKSPNIGNYPLIGKLQILYDLDLVERVGFVYASDKYGTKEESDYQTRPNVVELAQRAASNAYGYRENEVCIRSRIPPQYIKGVLVKDNNEKTELIKALRAEGLITLNTSNHECINGVPIDQFIHIGDFQPEYWA
jgi:hypothetical protein